MAFLLIFLGLYATFVSEIRNIMRRTSLLFLKVKSKKRWLIAGSILLLVIILFSATRGPSRKASGEADATPRVSLSFARDFHASSGYVEASGIVESVSQVDLRSEASSPVSAVYVQVGQAVQAGDILFEFEHADLNAQLAQSLAAVDQAQSSLDLLVTGVRDEDLEKSRLAILQAEASLVQAEAQREQTQILQDQIVRGVEIGESFAYANGFASANDALDSARDGLVIVADYQVAGLNCGYGICFDIANTKADAMRTLFGSANAGRWNAESVLSAHGGLEARLDLLAAGDVDDTDELILILQSIETGLSYTQSSLDATRVGLDSVLGGSATLLDKQTVDARRNLIDIQILSVQGYVSSIELAQNASLDDAIATRTSVMAVSDSLIAIQKASLAIAEQNLATLESGSRSLDLAPAEAGVRLALANYDLVASRLRTVIVRAPFAGTIASLPVRLSENIAPGQIMVSIVNPNGLEVLASISAADATMISLHSKVYVDEVHEAVITYISPRIDPQTGKVEIRLALVDEDTTFIIGQYIPVSIAMNAIDEELVYLLPLRAVQVGTESDAVFLVREGVVVSLPVETGAIRGSSVEIISGLVDEDQILSSIRGLSVGDTIIVE
jgi:RND family efflux transporter MFP subunit